MMFGKSGKRSLTQRPFTILGGDKDEQSNGLWQQNQQCAIQTTIRRIPLR